ncbi:rod shape-determining protein MreD [bacterium]|nr:rod shape-determining protein MreD [bacterium]
MDRFFIPLIGFCLVLLQTTLAGYVRIGEVAPDGVFLFVVFLALYRQNTAGLWAAFVFGLFQDVAGGGILGLNALLLLGITYLALYLRQKFFQENLVSQITIVMLFTFLHQFFTFFWMNTLLETQFHIGQWVGNALGMALYHAVMAPFVFMLFKKIIPDKNVARNFIGGQGGGRSHFSNTTRTG